jgi:hypothetical protein
MRREKTHKRGRVIPVLLAGGIGYLIGNAHIAAFRGTDLSAAEAVALRFPQDWKNASIATVAAIRTAALKARAPKIADVTGATATANDAQLALLSPEPMVPQTVVPQTVAETAPQADQGAAAQPIIQLASAEQVDTSTASEQAAPLPPTRAQRPLALSAQPTAKAAASAPHPRINDRPGYMLSDTQIASIKDRLHLTPDQEQMWPGVEAALRNIAYTRAQQARLHSAPANATQTAAVDPDAVQGLKSAAVPLIMSFNAEQKEEVRNIAHVMGLDQLASQF